MPHITTVQQNLLKTFIFLQIFSISLCILNTSLFLINIISKIPYSDNIDFIILGLLQISPINYDKLGIIELREPLCYDKLGKITSGKETICSNESR
jgi:hypothetical protein